MRTQTFLLFLTFLFLAVFTVPTALQIYKRCSAHSVCTVESRIPHTGTGSSLGRPKGIKRQYRDPGVRARAVKKSRFEIAKDCVGFSADLLGSVIPLLTGAMWIWERRKQKRVLDDGNVRSAAS
jgi:hypothetical protein